MRAAATFLGLNRGIVSLLGMLVLVGLGEKLFQRFIPRYLAELGAGGIVIGIYAFLDVGLGALYALPGGHFTDRLGHRRSLILFAVLNLAGYALLAVATIPTVLAALFLCTAWSQLSLPATFSLVAKQLPREKRVMGLAVQGIVRRVPMALGPVIGGAAFVAFGVVTGMRWMLLAAGVLTLLAVAIQFRLGATSDDASPSAASMFSIWRNSRRELKHLLLSDILIRFCEQIPNAFVILWVVGRLRRTDLEFGWLTAIEMGTAASLYIPVAWWVDRRAGKGRADGSRMLPVTERGPFILATFAIFTAFPVALYFAGGWWSLVLAFVIRGLKEFGEPARKATIVDLAAEDARARTVGIYYFLRDSTVACAALAGGAIWTVSPPAVLWTAFGCGVAGTAVFFALTRRASAR